MAKKSIDTLIKVKWLIPVEPENRVFHDYALIVNNGIIEDCLPSVEATNRYEANNTLDREQHLAIPGFINAHTHAAMSLLRGVADDLPLMTWLQEHIWPAESKWVNEEFVHDGTQLAIAEMISSGTTCFADMYFYPNIVANTAKQAYMRACVGLIVLDFPTVWAADANEYISKGTQLHDELHNDPLIHTMFAPHAPYTVSDAPLKRINTLADELDIPTQSHVHETDFEVKEALDKTGIRPLQRLQQLGLLNDNFMAVHMTQITDQDTALLAQVGCHVVHCPESNMKLASGTCPIQKLIQAGVNVALGTDGAASNNDLDMLGEMRSAALLAKISAGDASAVPAFTALKMATLNGAKALGIADKTGSLKIGKQADITIINLDHTNTQPLYDPISQLVYAAGREQVSDVFIGGQTVLRDKQLTTLNRQALLDKAKQWQSKISS